MNTLHKALLFAAATFFSLHVSAQRVVLLEQFSNAGCPPCAASTPKVLQYVDSNPSSVVAISYHTSFPYNDSMYHENPVQSDARVALYGIPSVPYSVLDGNYYSGSSSSFLNVMSSKIKDRKAIAGRYDIQVLKNRLENQVLDVHIAFNSTGSNTGDSLRAFVVVIERTVTKSSYAASPGKNSETYYSYVMRRMLPSEEGAQLTRRHTGGSDTLAVSWPLKHIKSVAEVEVVAFVQNMTTREVYQAFLSRPDLVTSVTGRDTGSLLLYPNPSGGFFRVMAEDVANATLLDISGRHVEGFRFEPESRQGVIPYSAAEGVYLVTLYDRNNRMLHQQKLLLKK
jgi:hypothetical protein